MLSFTGLVTWTHYLSLIRFCFLFCKTGITAVSSLRGWDGIMYEKRLRNCQAYMNATYGSLWGCKAWTAAKSMCSEDRWLGSHPGHHLLFVSIP